MKKPNAKDDLTPSQHIDNHIRDLNDWRGEMLTRLRKLILEAAPELTEEWKWDTPVWSQKGNVVAAGVFKDHVKLNFFNSKVLRCSLRLRCDCKGIQIFGAEIALDRATLEPALCFRASAPP